MMDLQFNKAEWQRDSGGVWLRLHAVNPRKAMAICEEVKPEKLYDCTIKLHREKRSMDANNYFWALVEQIADELYKENKETTKDAIYIEYVRHIGVYRDFILEDDAVSCFRTAWEMLGTGWPTEIVDYYPSGEIVVRAYYGSSQYNTKQMSKLIDAAVQDAKELGIETKTPEELALLKENWGKHEKET